MVERDHPEQLPASSDSRIISLGEHMNIKPSQNVRTKIPEKRRFRREVFTKRDKNEERRTRNEKVDGSIPRKKNQKKKKKETTDKKKKRHEKTEEKPKKKVRMKEVGAPVKSRSRRRRQKVKSNGVRNEDRQ